MIFPVLKWLWIVICTTRVVLICDIPWKKSITINWLQISMIIVVFLAVRLCRVSSIGDLVTEWLTPLETSLKVQQKDSNKGKNKENDKHKERHLENRLSETSDLWDRFDQSHEGTCNVKQKDEDKDKDSMRILHVLEQSHWDTDYISDNWEQPSQQCL